MQKNQLKPLETYTNGLNNNSSQILSTDKRRENMH